MVRLAIHRLIVVRSVVVRSIVVRSVVVESVVVGSVIITFMYLCIFVLKHWDLVFDILESPDLQKYSTLGLSSTLDLCICACI